VIAELQTITGQLQDRKCCKSQPWFNGQPYI